MKEKINNKISNFFIIIGTMLLFVALFLIVFNIHQDNESGESANLVMGELKENIKEMSENYTVPLEEETETQNEEIPVETLIEIDGNTYIGFISIPELSLELPVMSEWNYDNLKISPCRYKGTAFDGNLIIAAHNYQTHFGRLKEIYNGLKIYFTDGDGKVREYEIQQVETIDGQDIEAMELGSDDTWDLTLFTCTVGGASRVTVRAVEVKNNK
ncbi:MAG: sortase [Ruminococcus sp.]|nr:sortase [Ruminococcus sp.]